MERVVCRWRNCGVILYPKPNSRIGVCGKCHHVTCLSCDAAHEGINCETFRTQSMILHADSPVRGSSNTSTCEGVQASLPPLLSPPAPSFRTSLVVGSPGKTASQTSPRKDTRGPVFTAKPNSPVKLKPPATATVREEEIQVRCAGARCHYIAYVGVSEPHLNCPQCERTTCIQCRAVHEFETCEEYEANRRHYYAAQAHLRTVPVSTVAEEVEQKLKISEGPATPRPSRGFDSARTEGGSPAFVTPSEASIMRDAPRQNAVLVQHSASPDCSQMASPRCDKCIKARPGQRVVRGPHWWGGDEDGGTYYVGTIVSVCQPGTGSGYTTHPVEVQWDAGPRGYYRANCTKDVCDLRLIDASPTGLIFSDVTCRCCETKGVAGTRWKCAKCVDYNLCNSCYMSDKHNIEHEFLRYDGPGSEGFRVPSRKKSEKFQFYGIFPGAEVQSRNEDQTGILGSVRGEARLLRKTDAGKLCYNNTDKVHDILKFNKAASGGYYYRNHMPAIALPGHEPKDIELFQKHQKTMARTDNVRVIKKPEQLRSFTKFTFKSDPLWVCGRAGIVRRVFSSDLLGVYVDGHYYQLLPEWLIPYNKTSSSATNILGRDISSGGKGLCYGLSKMTALHAACHSGEEDVVRTLIMAGADLEEADKNGDRAVQYAAGREQSRILEVLLNSGVDIGACNMFNETALHVAIKENSVDCARLLAKNVKDCHVNIQDNTGDTVLHSAINAGMQQEIISLLLQVPTVNVAIKNSRGETPLHIAASKANLWATQQILQKSTDIVDEKTKTNVTALYIAVSNNLYEITKTLITQGHCNLDIQYGSGFKTALATAVARGYCDIVELLVESGADINTPDNEGNTSLHLCAINTQPLIHPSPSGAPKMSLMVQKAQEASPQRRLSGLTMAGLLASKGGDLQKQNKKGFTPPQMCDSTALVEMLLLWNTEERATGRYREQLSGLTNAKDGNGMVLLHREALNGRHHIVKMLLEQGYATVDTLCGHELKTALSIAAERGHRKLVELLVEAGADVNKVDAKGNTPLHISLVNHHFEIVELLVEAGADVNKQDANGNTPLHISLMSRRTLKASEISPVAAPKLKTIATELENVNNGDIDTSLALACFFISSGSSLKLKNTQGLNPLNVAGTMPVVRTLLKWAPKTREPPAEATSVERSAEGSTAVGGSAASAAQNTSGPVLSEEQKHCSSEKVEPKQEEIDDRHVCAICMERERTVAFLCGHGTCQECSTKIQQCHVCRAPVEKIIKLYEG